MTVNLIDSLPEEVRESLVDAIRNKKAIIIGGKTGVGKSTLTKNVEALIPKDMKVISTSGSVVFTSIPVASDSIAEALSAPEDVIVFDEIRGREAAVAYKEMRKDVSVIANIYSEDINSILMHFMVKVSDARDQFFRTSDVYDYVGYVIQMGDFSEDVPRSIKEICHVQSDGTLVPIYFTK